MLRPGRPIVVEGRYDRIRLSALIDGVILETGGFRIYKDRELLESLRALAQTLGLIILTDPDAAGFRIRSFLTNALGPRARLTQVYIPAVSGVERRKAAPSAEGLLGVEGLDQATLLEAFARAGIGCSEVAQKSALTVSDLYTARLTGAPGAAGRRRALLAALHLPPRLSTHSMLALLPTLVTEDEFWALVSSLPAE